MLTYSFNRNLAIHHLVEFKEDKCNLVTFILRKISKKERLVLFHTILYNLNHNNHSILQIAMSNNHLKTVEAIIKEFYPDNYCPDGNGNCPIHLAAETGNLDILEILVILSLF